MKNIHDNLICYNVHSKDTTEFVFNDHKTPSDLKASLFHNLLKTRKRQNGQTLFNVTKVTGVAFIWRTRKVKCYVSESRETKSYRETQPKTDEREQ